MNINSLSDQRVLRQERGRHLRLGLFLNFDERLELHLAMMVEAGSGRADGLSRQQQGHAAAGVARDLGQKWLQARRDLGRGLRG